MSPNIPFHDDSSAHQLLPWVWVSWSPRDVSPAGVVTGRASRGCCADVAPPGRGCLEAGLESLLKATGSNLLILRISHCPNVLTDRSLWLASCYCRALQAVTYR